jgi:hypothetical protein
MDTHEILSVAHEIQYAAECYCDPGSNDYQNAAVWLANAPPKHVALVIDLMFEYKRSLFEIRKAANMIVNEMDSNCP